MKGLAKFSRRNYPFESCAVLFGNNEKQEINYVIKVKNVFRSPFILGVKQSEYNNVIENNTQYDLMGIFHSHTLCIQPCSLSYYDYKNIINKPELIYVICDVSKYEVNKFIIYRFSKEKNMIIKIEVKINV